VIVLDTNVLSELMRPTPDPRVIAWFAEQTDLSLWTTALTRAELHHGVVSLPLGRRRTQLAGAVDAMFRDDFQGRVLAFTSDAAVVWADIVVARRASGRPISHVDAQIAAVARLVDATLATRNVDDFSDCGLTIVNPWAA
jgi:predicted nucleic acid-binding protein